MRFMILIKADKDSEAGAPSDEKLLSKTRQFNQEPVKAGVMVTGEGLRPRPKGKRVRVSGERRTVIDGPFAETKELIAGFWPWQVKSMKEANESVERAPFGDSTNRSEFENRQAFQAEGFGAEFTPELSEQEERLRAQIEKQSTS